MGLGLLDEKQPDTGRGVGERRRRRGKGDRKIKRERANKTAMVDFRQMYQMSIQYFSPAIFLHEQKPHWILNASSHFLMLNVNRRDGFEIECPEM